MNWTEESLRAYLAGHIDSDGSIGISNNGTKSKTFRLRISLYNNCKETLDWLEDHFGGTIHGRQPHPSRFARQTQYTLVWQAKEGYGLLQLVVPYLRTKRAQGALAMAFYERNLGHGYNGHADRSWQITFYEDMKALNQRYRGAV